MAAGPNHVVGLVNSRIGIFTKTGTNVQTISAPAFYNTLLPGNDVFDPKIIYDHFANRWVMSWLDTDFSTFAWIVVSVSDDSDPTGTWCSFAFPGDMNGSTATSEWSDYQGMGYDQDAVYIAPNQFTFAFQFAGVKLRILPKSTLYDTACPAVTYTDFWDLRDPSNTSIPAFTVRPATTFGTPGSQFMISNPPLVTTTYMVLWELTDPLNPVPTLTASAVPVTSATPPPDANQLGGGSPLIDVGGPRVRNSVFRNGSIWTAHSVADATGQFARARYVRIDVSGPTTTEDVSFGADNCWLYYPAITVDANESMVMVYNQSCTDEFISARYTGRTPSDPDVQPSAELKAGEANYVKTFGGPSNRWGDYSGIAVDPANPTRIWMFAEYAASPANIWGTWFGEVSSRAVGDVNNDGTVNVADVTLTVEFVLEISSPATQEDFLAADCAANSVLDIGDIVCIVGITLSPSGRLAVSTPISTQAGANARLNLAESWAIGGKARAARELLLEADVESGVAGVQVTISYDPSRARFGEPRLEPRAAGFQIASHDDGSELRLLIFSLEQKALRAGDGPILRIPLEPIGRGFDESSIRLEEVLLADRAGRVVAANLGQAKLTSLATEFSLSDPYPNPIGFAGTKLDLEIPRGVVPEFSGAGAASGQVRVIAEVFNVRGQLVRKVMDEVLTSGRHVIAWDGRSENGAFVSSGLYVVRVRAGDFIGTRKLIVAPSDDE